MNGKDEDELASRLRDWAGEAVPGEGMAGLIERLQGIDATEADLLDWLEFPPRDGEPGRLGRFELMRVIAEGGMGVVIEARDPLLERRVALKLLKPELWVRPDWRDRFLAEARAMALIDHPAVLPVYEVVDTGAEVFFVMPLVEGGSLQDRLDAGESLAVGEVRWLAGRLAAALDAVHGAGLVHGDIKPANVLFDRERKRVWLADFGIVASSGESGSGAGTPAWMAPERCEGPADRRSDWHELGGVLRAAAGGREDAWLRALVGDLQKEDPAARLADGREVMRRLQRRQRRKRLQAIATAILGLLGVAAAGLSATPAGLVGGINRGLAEVGGGRIWIEGRIGTFDQPGEAVKRAGGRKVILDFDGTRRMAPAVFEGRGAFGAGPGRRPVLVPEQRDVPLWTVNGHWEVDGVRLERESSGVGSPLIEVAAGGRLALRGFVVWDRETMLRGRAAGAVVRLKAGASLESRDGMVFVDGRAWLLAEGGGGSFAARNVVFGGGGGVVAGDAGDFAVTVENCTIVLARFLIAGEAKVTVKASRCVLVTAIAMTDGTGSGLRWQGRGNWYQGRGVLAPGVPDPRRWSELAGVDEQDFRSGDLPLPDRRKTGRAQLERQVIESHRSWPEDLGAGADPARLPGYP
jgi:hypothetical protein